MKTDEMKCHLIVPQPSANDALLFSPSVPSLPAYVPKLKTPRESIGGQAGLVCAPLASSKRARQAANGKRQGR